MPRISVVISAYNAQIYISKALDSVLNQSYKKFEILVLDDHSTDNTLNILKKYSKKFPNKIKIFKNKKKIGLTKSLIKLINKAKGKYIARLDADDFWHKDILKFHSQWLIKRTNNVLIGSSGYKVDSKDKIVGNFNLKNLNHSELKKKLLFKNYFLHSSTMFKKKYYNKVGGYNPFFKFAQDYDLWCKLSTVGQIKNTNRNLVFLRQLNTSITSRNKKEQSIFALIISCIYKNKKNINFKNNNLLVSIRKLKKITSKNHFNSLCYLYSEYLPEDLSKKFLDLNLSMIKYLLKDKNFFFRATIKKFFFK